MLTCNGLLFYLVNKDFKFSVDITHTDKNSLRFSILKYKGVLRRKSFRTTVLDPYENIALSLNSLLQDMLPFGLSLCKNVTFSNHNQRKHIRIEESKDDVIIGN